MDGSKETLLRLKEKPPDAHPDRQLPPPLEGNGSSSKSSICPIVTREEVRLVIRSFRKGSGGGPDRLLPQHLKDMTSGQLGVAVINLLDASTDF